MRSGVRSHQVSSVCHALPSVEGYLVAFRPSVRDKHPLCKVRVPHQFRNTCKKYTFGCYSKRGHYFSWNSRGHSPRQDTLRRPQTSHVNIPPLDLSPLSKTKSSNNQACTLWFSLSILTLKARLPDVVTVSKLRESLATRAVHLSYYIICCRAPLASANFTAAPRWRSLKCQRGAVRKWRG